MTTKRTIKTKITAIALTALTAAAALAITNGRRSASASARASSSALSGASSAASTSSSPQPGAMLEINLQNYTVLTDTEHDWYTSARPAQKSLYQLSSEYVEGEGAVFNFYKNDNHPDPMIYLPVYDICYNINIKDYPFIAVCYKSNATNQDGVFYFATSANQGLAEGKSVGISMKRSEDWTLAIGDARKNKNWTGRLTQLRFDISSGEFSGQYTVKWIGFFKTADDATKFGVNGVYTKNIVTPDKAAFDRGEDITFSVTGAQKGDWAVLVQKGDACYADSLHKPDLYVSDCMPLYCTDVEEGRGTFSLDGTDGIYKNTLLPAGEYDIVFMPRGRYVETGRASITITETVAREPETTEIIYVTRGPDPTETPEVTEEPFDEPTALPTATDGRHRITLPPTEVPKDSSGAKPGLVIAIVAILCCAACLAIFFIARGRKLKKREYKDADAE